jgi:hypothetical protein
MTDIGQNFDRDEIGIKCTSLDNRTKHYGWNIIEFKTLVLDATCYVCKEIGAFSRLGTQI